MKVENRINHQPSDTQTFRDLWASKIPEIKQLTEEELAREKQKEALEIQQEMGEVASTHGISVERVLSSGPTLIFDKNGEVHVNFSRKPPKHKPSGKK